MKKVLILVNHNVVIYNFRKELVERLIHEGYEVYLSCPQGDRIGELISMGCKFVEADFDRRGTNPLSDLKLVKYYKRIMKDIKPDVVLSYTIKPNVYGGIAAAKLKIPQIANVTGLGTSVEDGGILQKISVTLYRYGLRKAKMVYFQNESNMKFMKEHKVVSENYYVLPGSGVNLTRFSVSEYPKDDIVKFLFISRIMKEKGIDQYLEAAETIRKKYPNTEFHICGFCEKEYKGKLNEFIEKGVVIYHGMIRDVPDFLNNIHCLVHPTYYPEGLSNVLLEACASGRPIITTDRPGCREVVDNGINGYMIPQKDSKELIKAIECFLKLSYVEKKHMGLNARKKVEECFDRQIVVDEYIKLIDKILN